MELFSKKRIYADAAAATPLSKKVETELFRLLKLFGNPGALHKEAVAAKKELDLARKSITTSLGAHPDEIIFTSGGTEANNLAIFGVLKKYINDGERVHAITSSIEHSSVLEPLSALMDEGLELTLLPVDERGIVDPKQVHEAIKENTVLISIQTVNSEIGTIQDIREIAKEVRHRRKERLQKFASNSAGGEFLNLPLLYHTDASQAPLWLKLNVEKLGVDLLTLDAQKIMGPKGVGTLFVRRGTELTPLIYGGGQEKGIRSGTENVAYAGALAVALKDAQDGVEERVRKISQVRNFTHDEIKNRISNVKLNGAEISPSTSLGTTREVRVANNLNISIPNLNGDMAVIGLDAEGVAISTRSACDTDDDTPSHVLAAIGLDGEAARNSIRITFLPDATIAEARLIAKKLAEVASRYRLSL